MIIEDHGTIVIVKPENDLDRMWLEENVVSEEWQWIGGNLHVDHRMAHDLIDGLHEAGLLTALPAGGGPWK